MLINYQLWLKSKTTDGLINLLFSDIPKLDYWDQDLLNIYLLGLMKEHLTSIEYEVLRLSFGLDCDKHSANYIASKLNINVNTANVRVSQIKKEAIDKLIANTDPTQVIDYL